jgi:hypothetical protein
MPNIIISCLIFIFGFGCCKVKDEELSMQRRNYTGNELRTDGYYYRYQWHNFFNKEQIVVDCLYRNGIIRACGGGYDSFQDFENNIDVINAATSNPNKNFWGVFIVENDIIKYEMWHGARFLEPYITYIYAGKILNDTTFHITESYRPNSSEKNTLDYTYHFKQFYPKPDSTNIFIK